MTTAAWIVLACFWILGLVVSHAYAYGSGKGKAWEEAQDEFERRWRLLIGPNGSRWVSYDGHLERLP